MALRKSAAVTAGRVPVPRAYVRAALRGLQGVAGRQFCAGTPYNCRHLLDEALRYTSAFQERCSKRWAEAALVSASHNGGVGIGGGVTIVPGSVRTLQHLVALDGEDNSSHLESANTAVDEEEHQQSFVPTFAEKQQARLHATLQQWVVYCGFRTTRTDFESWQPMVSRVLLLSPSRVVPSSRSSPEAANLLEASLRRRGAKAYVDLLVHHRLALRREEEWVVVCELCAPAKELPRRSDGDAVPPVMSLPFIRSSTVDASWERSLAVLSWAVQFQQKKPHERCHISSADISSVLQQYVQHFGQRIQVSEIPLETDEDGGAVPLTVSAEQDVVARLQRWWAAARAVEQQSPKLAAACRVDHTAPGWMHVEGRKVALAPCGEAPTASGTVFAELLLQGRWAEVQQRIERVAIEASRRQGPTESTGGEAAEVATVVGEAWGDR
ncbi:RNA pseudouridylate synthase protein, partial [Trypanosoma grayi]|uniref:RNA pseudouridylate synthase protein n=1 Tax=Trypanosoma grayi TaxID=71804 RepID=UPI0004F41539